MSRSAASSSAKRPHLPLNRDLILDQAVALIEQEGPASLSMRRLGSRLGVEGMAIYHHFKSRDELIDAIGDRLLSPLRALELGPEWRDACRRFAAALRAVAVAQPATFQLLGLAPFDTTSSLQPVERLLRVLVNSGFSPAQGLAIYRATVSFARGYALAEATGFTVDAARPSGLKRLASLPPDEFPILAKRRAELAELDAEAGFHSGLDALLKGLPDPSSAQGIG